MPDILDRHGLTDDAVVKKYLIPALKATEMKYAQHEGKFTDERERKAWGPRLQSLDMYFNLRGAYQKAVPTVNTNVVVALSAAEREQARECLRRIRAADVEAEACGVGQKEEIPDRKDVPKDENDSEREDQIRR